MQQFCYNTTMIKAIISDSDGTLVNTLYLIRHGQYEAGAVRVVDDLLSIPKLIEAHNSGESTLF